MKKYIYIFLFVLSMPLASLNSASKYLMDPMPSHNKAPEFTLMGMDEKIHTLKSLEGRFLLVKDGTSVQIIKWDKAKIKNKLLIFLFKTFIGKYLQ